MLRFTFLNNAMLCDKGPRWRLELKTGGRPRTVDKGEFSLWFCETYSYFLFSPYDDMSCPLSKTNECSIVPPFVSSKIMDESSDLYCFNYQLAV